MRSWIRHARIISRLYAGSNQIERGRARDLDDTISELLAWLEAADREGGLALDSRGIWG